MIKLIKNKLNFIPGNVIQQHGKRTPKIYQNLSRLMPMQGKAGVLTEYR
jgi:hypothetical protein